MASPGISSICSPVYRNRSARPSPSTTVPSSPATSRCAAWRSTPSFAILMRLGRKAASRMQSGECAASCLARPTLRRSRAADSATSWPPTTTLRVNALTSEPQLRPLPKCCTSSVNPPPRFRGDDAVSVATVESNTHPPNKTAGVAAGFDVSFYKTARLVRGFQRGLFSAGDGALDRRLHLFKGADFDLAHAFARHPEFGVEIFQRH